MNILIVEDDPQISNFIAKGLHEAGYTTESCDNGNEALYYLQTNSFHLVILDLMLKEKDGLEVLNEARSMGHTLPVIILSAKRTVDDRVLGLQNGADDYLIKPFSFAELLARIQALLKRRSNYQEIITELHHFGIHQDLLKREVHRNDQKIELQPKEFALLEYFMRHPQKILSKTMILENVYGYHFDTQTNVIDVLVSRLRQKVDKGFDKKLIHTLRGIGYVLKEVDSE